MSRPTLLCMPPPFVPFSALHGWTLLAGFAVIAGLIAAGRRGGQTEFYTRMLLVVLCLSEFLYSKAAWAGVPRDVSVDHGLPFHLCDVAALVAGLALLMEKKPRLAALTYYWGLAATIQGLATPALATGFPHPVFFAFFVHHFAVVGAALYLPLVRGWRPQAPFWKEPLTAWGWSLGYATVAGMINWMLGTNFGFLAKKPDNPSLLDTMGPWPWYIGVEALVALVFYLILTLPFVKQSGERSAET